MVRKPFQDTFCEITSVIIVLENRKGLLILASICFNEFPIFQPFQLTNGFLTPSKLTIGK